jgi:hypothetical protein
MPRRNRNVHAPATDPDKLADQARQLTTELCYSGSGMVSLVADETQLYRTSPQGPGKPPFLRAYLAERISRHPGGHIVIADAKAVTSDGR